MAGREGGTYCAGTALTLVLHPQRFFQDPYSTTFSSFSRVTNFFRGALQPHPGGASPDLLPAPEEEPEPGFEVISCVSIWGWEDTQTPAFLVTPSPAEPATAFVESLVLP